MRGHELIAKAATPTIGIIHEISDGQLDNPSPCTEFSARGLVNHLLFWGPSLEGAGRKEAVSPPGTSDRDVDLTTADWDAELTDQINRITEAWSRPDAWDGMTRMGGPSDMPATMIGEMVCAELVVHGWDLARATDQDPKWDEDVLTFVYESVAATAPMGREMGIYGPVVEVPVDASTMDQILGLTGRDPNWTP